MSETPRSLLVPEDVEGVRLDRFLAATLSETSRSTIRRWIDGGLVSVDGTPATRPGMPIRPGMRLAVLIPDAPAVLPEPEQIELSVLFEDDDLIAIDKPAGLVVHPGHGNRTGTLVNALLGRGVPLAPAGGSERPGIVHRLDRGTSGVLVVAKTDVAYRGLADAFVQRLVRKRYLALSWGHPSPEAGRIERAIGRSRGNPLKMAVQATRGRTRPATSEYRTLESLPGFSWLEILPETGRTHQIRVHMQSIHHPLVGDEQYGGRAWRGVQDPIKRKALREFERLALHASTLAFAHPCGGAAMRFSAPLPAELDALLTVLRRP